MARELVLSVDAKTGEGMQRVANLVVQKKRKKSEPIMTLPPPSDHTNEERAGCVCWVVSYRIACIGYFIFYLFEACGFVLCQHSSSVLLPERRSGIFGGIIQGLGKCHKTTQECAFIDFQDSRHLHQTTGHESFVVAALAFDKFLFPVLFFADTDERLFGSSGGF